MEILHLSRHEDAELYALRVSVALAKIGALLFTLETKLGEVAIFDPEATIKEATIKDGVSFGRMLCEYLIAEGTRVGLGPEALQDHWQDMVQGAIAHEVNRRKQEEPHGSGHDQDDE
jgi:hypothetical protein